MVAWGSRAFVTFALLSVELQWGTPALVDAQTAAQEVAIAGKPAFELYCATCHGRDAKGDGPASSLLTVKPADLMAISKRNNGTFPFWHVYSIIDGREDVRGHGSREMPIWGTEFRSQAAASMTAQSQVRGRILELVYYLESIQTK